MNNRSKIEINYFYQHKKDADQFLSLAKKENTKLKSFYARHALLSSVFASEALINRVYEEFYCAGSEERCLKTIEKLSIQEKWMLAPLTCGKGKPPGEIFKQDEEPFQSFNELVKIRNNLVHPKPGVFVDTEEDGKIEWIDGPTVPNFRAVPGTNFYPQTRIPKNPFEFNEEHAEKSIKILEDMVNILLGFFKDVFNENWLFECAYKIGEDEIALNIKHVWGGLTPIEDKDF